MPKGEDRNKVVGKLQMQPGSPRWNEAGGAGEAGGAAAGSDPKKESAAAAPAPAGGGKRIVATCSAALLLIDGRLVLREVDPAGRVIVNGNPATQARVKEGDYLQIGDYEIYVAETPTGTAKAARPGGSTTIMRAVKVLDAEVEEEADAPVPVARLAPAAAGAPPASASPVTRDDSEAAEGEGAEVTTEEVDEGAFDEAEAAAAPADATAPAAGDKSFLDAIPPARRLPLALAAAFLVVFLGVGVWVKTHPTQEEPEVTVADLIQPGLVAFEENRYPDAVTAFEKAKKNFPESRLPRTLVDLAKQFRDEIGDLSKFDWKLAQTRVRDIAGMEDASEEVKKFAKDKLAWLQREEQASGIVSQAADFAEKEAYENALALVEKLMQEQPQPDSLVMVTGELSKWRASLRKKYIAKADEILAGQDPNWTEASAALKKAQEFTKQNDAEIADKLARCEVNLKAKKDLADVISMFDQGLFQDALDSLDRIHMGTFYDRAVTNLRERIITEQKFRQAVQAYRNKDLHRAADLLSHVNDKKCTDFLAKLKAIESGMEEGRRLLGLRDYKGALKAFQSVLSAEPDRQNPYNRDADEGFQNCKKRMVEMAFTSYARGEQCYTQERYGEALDEFQKALDWDESGQLATRLKTRVLTDAQKIFKEVRSHFITSSATQADYQALQILVNYLDKSHPVYKDAQDLLKGKHK